MFAFRYRLSLRFSLTVCLRRQVWRCTKLNLVACTQTHRTTIWNKAKVIYPQPITRIQLWWCMDADPTDEPGAWRLKTGGRRSGILDMKKSARKSDGKIARKTKYSMTSTEKYKWPNLKGKKRRLSRICFDLGVYICRVQEILNLSDGTCVKQ